MVSVLSVAFLKDFFAEWKPKSLFYDSSKVKPANFPGSPAPGFN